MSRFLADTNAIGEYARPSPEPAVTDWLATLAAIGLSAITVEEIAYGLAANPRQDT